MQWDFGSTIVVHRSKAMKSQFLYTVWCDITGEAAGEVWTSSLMGVKGLNVMIWPRNSIHSLDNITNELVQCNFRNQNCAHRKRSLHSERNFISTSGQSAWPWRQKLTNRSDVKYIFFFFAVAAVRVVNSHKVLRYLILSPAAAGLWQLARFLACWLLFPAAKIIKE